MAPVRACARAASRMALRRTASRSSRVEAGSGNANATRAVETPIRATTTINSSRVNPRARCKLLPGADVSVLALAATLAVSTEAEDIDRAVEAGVHVLVRIAPGVFAQ